MLQKLAEAEERVGEITALKARVRELEEENGALTQTLEEMRQSSEQLQRLRAMEEQQGVGAAAAAATFAAAVASERSAAAAAAGRAAELERGAAATVTGAPAGKSKGKAASVAAGSSRASAGGDSATAAPAAVAPASPPRSPAASVSSAGGAGGPGSQAGGPAAPPPPPPPPAGKGREATRLAEQLAAAAGGADVGVVASAAKCLRDYAALEAALTHERQVRRRGGLGNGHRGPGRRGVFGVWGVFGELRPARQRPRAWGRRSCNLTNALSVGTLKQASKQQNHKALQEAERLRHEWEELRDTLPSSKSLSIETTKWSCNQPPDCPTPAGGGAAAPRGGGAARHHVLQVLQAALRLGGARGQVQDGEEGVGGQVGHRQSSAS